MDDLEQLDDLLGSIETLHEKVRNYMSGGTPPVQAAARDLDSTLVRSVTAISAIKSSIEQSFRVRTGDHGFHCSGFEPITIRG